MEQLLITISPIILFLLLVISIKLLTPLSRFKWYRKLRGGKWYYIKYRFSEYSEWLQNEPPFGIIIKEEDYTKQNIQ